MFTSLSKLVSFKWHCCNKKWDGLNVTLTAWYQFDVSSVDESFLIAGLTANCDLLGLVEGHLAAHLAGFTSLTEADVGPDAQHLWFWYQRLPDCCLIAAPAVGQEISRWNHWHCAQFESKINFCVCSTPKCYVTVQWWMEGAVTYLSMLSQLYHCMDGVGTPSATQVTKCLFPGRWWSVRSLIWAGTTHRGYGGH